VALLFVLADLARCHGVPDRGLTATEDRGWTKQHAGDPVHLGQSRVGVPLGDGVVVPVVADERRRLVHVTDAGGPVVHARGGDVQETFDAGVAGRPGEDRCALDRDPVLVVAVGAHRMHRRDDRVRALDHGDREVRVVEVADPLLDAGLLRRSSLASYDGPDSRAALEQRGADV